MEIGWCRFITIMAVIVAAWGKTEDGAIESGILLRHMGEVIVSGDSWTAMATINVEAIVTLLEDVTNLISQLRTMVQGLSLSKVLKDTVMKEISIHENRAVNVASKAMLFKNMLPIRGRRRRRRSLGDIVGLFETSEPHPRFARGSNNQTLTVLTALEERIRRNVDMVKNITLSRSSDMQVSNSGLRTLSTVVEDLDSFLEDALEGMVALADGRLSPNLVTPSELVTILRKAKDKFSGSVRPLTELSEDDVYAYYIYSSIRATANATSITVYVNLPFKADGRVFDLYEPHPFPAYHPTAGVYLEVSRPSELVLVSKLKDKAAEIHSGRILENCRRRVDTFLCPADITLDDTGFSCTLALILGQEDKATSLCDRKVIPQDFEPRWVRAPSGWYYSVSQPTKILRISESEKVPVIRYLEGTGFLKDEPGTYTKTENGAVLFPADMLGERFHTDKGEVIIPPLLITNLLKDREVDAIQRRRADEEERARASVSILALVAASERLRDVDRAVQFTALVGAYIFLIILAFGSRLKTVFLATFTRREQTRQNLESTNEKEVLVSVPQEATSSALVVPVSSQKQSGTETEKQTHEKRRRRRIPAKDSHQDEHTSVPKLPPRPALPLPTPRGSQHSEYFPFFNRKKRVDAT